MHSLQQLPLIGPQLRRRLVQPLQRGGDGGVFCGNALHVRIRQDFRLFSRVAFFNPAHGMEPVPHLVIGQLRQGGYPRLAAVAILQEGNRAGLISSKGISCAFHEKAAPYRMPGTLSHGWQICP